MSPPKTATDQQGEQVKTMNSSGQRFWCSVQCFLLIYQPLTLNPMRWKSEIPWPEHIFLNSTPFPCLASKFQIPWPFHDHMNLYTDCSVSRIMQSSHEGEAQMPGTPITCMYPNSYHHSVFPRLGSPIFKLLKVSNIVLISQEDNAIRLSGPSHYSPDPSSNRSLTWFPRVLQWRHMAWKWGPQLDKDLQDAKINQCYSTVWT